MYESSQRWGNSLDLKYKQKVLKIMRLYGLGGREGGRSAAHLGIPTI